MGRGADRQRIRRAVIMLDRQQYMQTDRDTVSHRYSEAEIKWAYIY